MRRLLLLPLALVAAAAAACGGSPRPAAAPSPSAASSANYATADDALAGLDRAERELQAAVGSPAAGAPAAQSATRSLGGAAPAAPAATAAPTPAAPNTATDGDADEAKPEQDAAPATGCPVACRALASMRRAADAVCRLTSDADPRCADARARVEASASSVARCGCA